MIYHADYDRIILNVYDYECSQQHASFHMYVWGDRLVIQPPPQIFLNKENGEKKSLKTKSEVIGLHATEVQQQK